jgi:hypothetical protein
VNGFQYGHEEIGAIIPEDCGRMVILVDMTSLPLWHDGILITPPNAYHLRPETVERRKMSCKQTVMDIWVIDSKEPCDVDVESAEKYWNPNEDDLIEFSINWDLINQHKG